MGKPPKPDTPPGQQPPATSTEIALVAGDLMLTANDAALTGGS